MNDTQIEKLRAAFREALQLPGGTEIDVLEYNKHKSWDSVAHMTLVAAIEDAFGVMLETDDVLDMSSFTKAKEIVAKYNVAG